MRGYQNNFGKTIPLSQASFVTSHYGAGRGNGYDGNGAYLGAEANWATVLEAPREDDDTQLRIFNIVTWLGGYELPEAGESPARHLSILGRLIYGVGGATFQVDFDWKVGTQLSVAASFVTVLAAYAETGSLLAPSEVSVGAALGSGSRASRSQITRTFPQVIMNDATDPSGVRIIPVPPQAHALNLFSADPEFYETGEVSVRFLGGANNGFSAASTADLVSFVTDGVPFLQALATEDGVRFSESVKFIELSTTTDGQDYRVTPCFTLNL